MDFDRNTQTSTYFATQVLPLALLPLALTAAAAAAAASALVMRLSLHTCCGRVDHASLLSPKS